MAKFSVGDVVQLKSGSPRMTVKRYDEENDVTCIWFVDGKNTVAHFPEETLKTADPETVPYVGGSYVAG